MPTATAFSKENTPGQHKCQKIQQNILIFIQHTFTFSLRNFPPKAQNTERK